MAGAELTRSHLVIRGLVQGVSYRASARAQALELNVKGWVRNLASGDVEAVVEGPPERVRAFVDWCRRGPDEAHVESVRETPGIPTGEFIAFVVAR